MVSGGDIFSYGASIKYLSEPVVFPLVRISSVYLANGYKSLKAPQLDGVYRHFIIPHLKKNSTGIQQASHSKLREVKCTLESIIFNFSL